MAVRNTKAKTTEAQVDPGKSERDAKMRAAYQRAEKRLKEAFPDEWNSLLTEEYALAGVEVRRRLTDEEREAREAAKVEEKRQRLLKQLADLGGIPEVLPLEPSEDEVAGDPFAA